MQLWDKFLQEWPPEKVRSMSLEEYTNLNRKDAFIYWLEFRTRALGSIRGGDAIKFGIYHHSGRDPKSRTEGRIRGAEYTWDPRYGDTEQVAFDTVRSRLVQVIGAARRGDLAALDDVDVCWPLVKWKVAFLYQDREDPGILAVYRKDLLETRYKEAFPNAAKVPQSQQHAALIEHYSWLGDALDISPAIWNTTGRRYWLMSLGLRSDRWPACRQSGTASIGFSGYPVGDLSQYATQKQVGKAMGTAPSQNPMNDRLALWEFSHVMKPGDVIFVKRGSDLIGHGAVRSDYRYDGTRNDHQHIRQVHWQSNFPNGIRVREKPLVQKTLTDITKYPDQVDAFKEAIRNAPPPDGLSHPRNQILYGPPGTGKTYAARGYARAIVDEKEPEGHADGESRDGDDDPPRFDGLPPRGSAEPEGRIAMVTFHQNYAYEDFVEGIRPKLATPTGSNDQDADAEEASPSSELGYELKPGHFRRICEAAEMERLTAAKEGREPKRFVLIIDEINRGNIPKIFGELITVIEDSRRLGADDETRVTLPYSGDDFGVPDNLYIIGTMNTADRSIQQLDTALRRRFTFVEMMPDPDHELIPAIVDGVNCREMLRALNERIAVLMDREHQIGHTYLFAVEDLGDLADRFRNKILPLLQEYFYDDWRKIRAVLRGNAFVKERKVGEGHAKDLIREFDLVDEETVIHERLPAGDPAWKEASQYRQIYEPVATD